MLTIGVLDSGMGGLSVLDALLKAIPAARFIYAADHAGMPWGDKSQNAILKRTQLLLEKLLEAHPACIVFACNTATLTALETLQKGTSIPLVGVRPQDLFLPTLTGDVGVMATQASIESPRYQATKRAFLTQHPGVRIWDMPCPGLMEFVERGELASPGLDAFLRAKFDAVPPLGTCLLSCTHYPFLIPRLQALHPHTTFLDPSRKVTESVWRTLNRTPSTTLGGSAEVDITFWSTAPTPSRDTILSTLLPEVPRDKAHWQLLEAVAST